MNHHAFSAQRSQVESFKTATYAIGLHSNLQEFAKKLPFHRLLLGCSRHRIKKLKSPSRKSSGNLSSKWRKKAWNGLERLRTCPKVAPKLAHRSRVVVAVTRKKTAQAPSVLATTTVLSALIMNERIRLIAMVVGMRIVAHNGTELARWTCTSTQSQLFSLLVQSGADLHSCRSTVNSWSAESAPGFCDHRRSTSEERTPSTSTCVSCRSTRTQLYRGSIFLRTLSLT